MKAIRGSILKKLKSIPSVPYLKPNTVATNERILHVHASDAPPPAPDPCRVLRDLPVANSSSPEQLTPVVHPQEVIDVAELMKDLDDPELDLSSSSSSDKENSTPPPKKAISWSTNKKKRSPEISNPDAPSYRRPDLDSATLFDPELLAAFEEAVAEHMRSFEEAKSRARARALPMEEQAAAAEEAQPHGADEPPAKVPRTDDDVDPLMEFVYRCPPGGSESVVLYTTTLRGIRKTFEDCNAVRFLLESLKVKLIERDVSMHLEFREELWRVLGGRAIPPRLFIRGRYVGGADEVLGLHEQGRLLPLLRGLPSAAGGGVACEGCGGVRFVLCWECSGSRKVYGEEQPLQCRHCNENGLVVCPICCC